MFSRANRWDLSITTRAGLGVVGIADSRAPVFDFGSYFVVDVFIDFSGAGVENLLANIIRYDIEYLESQTDAQRELDSCAKPIDTAAFVSLLSHEISELQPYVSGKKSYDFMGDPSRHLQSMRDAVVFLESNSREPLFLVASFDA